MKSDTGWEILTGFGKQVRPFRHDGHWHPIDDISADDAAMIVPSNYHYRWIDYSSGARAVVYEMPHKDVTYRIYESHGNVSYFVWAAF